MIDVLYMYPIFLILMIFIAYMDTVDHMTYAELSIYQISEHMCCVPVQQWSCCL